MLSATDKKTFLLGGHQLPYSFFADNGNGENGWIVDFINQLFQNIFKISLVMLENENVREFPIAYSEEQTYSTIANAIGKMTPYHVSEMYIGKNNNKKRYVDFWCRCIDEKESGKIRDIWIECKNLWFNIGKNAKLEQTTKYQGIIQKAIGQIKTIENKMEKDSFRVAFFSVYLYYHVSNQHQQLHSMCNKAYERIRQAITDNSKGYIVYSILDLRETIQDDNKEKILKKNKRRESLSNIFRTIYLSK